VEEELVFFVTGDLTAVSDKNEETDSDRSPNNKQDRKCAEIAHREYLIP
jgi:hypothetical protein